MYNAEKKDLTVNDIEKLNQMYEQLSDLQETMSEQIKTAQDRHGKEEIEVTRGGKDVKVMQNAVWLECFKLGEGSTAWDDLKALYPEIFEIKAKEAALVQEIKAFEILTFGYDGQQLTLPRVIDLVRQLVRLEMTRD